MPASWGQLVDTFHLTPNLVIKPPRVINYVGPFCAQLFNRKLVLRRDSRQSGERSHPRLPGAVLAIQIITPCGLLETSIWNHLQPSGDIWAIWGKLEARGAIWNHPRLSGAILVTH